MALNRNPLIKDDSTLLLNQDSTTFQIKFSDLAQDVVNIINGGSGKDPILEISDNLDVNTSLYISQRDSDGAPAGVLAFDSAGGSVLTDINDINGTVPAGHNAVSGGQKYWLLQWVPGADASGGFGNVDGEGQFILRDPLSIFADVVDSISGNIGDSIDIIIDSIDSINDSIGGIDDSIGDLDDKIDDIADSLGAIELNTLLDVQTRVGDDNSAPLANTLDYAADNEAFLLSNGTVEGADGTDLPNYQPASLSEQIQKRIDDKDVEIELEQIKDVDPTALGRLILNPAWYPAAGTTIPKYANDPSQDDPKFDDILVHIDDPQAQIDGAGPGDTVAGWYYAEAAFGDELNPAGIADDTVNAVGAEVKLGGVRVLTYKNTELEEVNGITQIKAYPPADLTPTNIKITKDGVLYSEIPNTLTFRQTIDIYSDGSERFASVSPPTDAAAQVPQASAGPGGPGFWTSPEDATTAPSVGDFYVVHMQDGVPANPGDSTAGVALTSTTLEWRAGTGADGTGTQPGEGGNKADGSAPIVEDGDLVTWGGQSWVVIGTVNTDTIAQDLQATTARGDTTTIGIRLVNADMSASDSVSSIALGTSTDGQSNVLSVGSIDFDRFPILTP